MTSSTTLPTTTLPEALGGRERNETMRVLVTSHNGYIDTVMILMLPEVDSVYIDEPARVLEWRVLATSAGVVIVQ
jgi:hypothetical protein